MIGTAEFFGLTYSWPEVPNGPYPLGKYETLRDEYLHKMACDGWANASSGDVESPTGYFYLICNSAPEMKEITEAFGPAPTGIVGNFILVENDQGFVIVHNVYTSANAEAKCAELENAYDGWQDSENDD